VERKESFTSKKIDSPIVVKSSNLRLREEGEKIFIQIFDDGLNEFPVKRDSVRKLLAEYSLPDFFWDLLSNESIVSVANDYLLSKENKNFMLDLS
jgi:hypothetical protein